MIAAGDAGAILAGASDGAPGMLEGENAATGVFTAQDAVDNRHQTHVIVEESKGPSGRGSYDQDINAMPAAHSRPPNFHPTRP